MSAMNRHVIEVSGETLREVSEAAMAAFDAFFDREIDWHVIEMDTQAEMMEARDGANRIIARGLVTWRARVVAEAAGVHIGAAKHEAAMLFKPLGT